jgi:hypothetical protein
VKKISILTSNLDIAEYLDKKLKKEVSFFFGFLKNRDVPSVTRKK